MRKQREQRLTGEIESPRGFTSAPTLEQLRPTAEELDKFKLLHEWMEQSARSKYIWH